MSSQSPTYRAHHSLYLKKNSKSEMHRVKPLASIHYINTFFTAFLTFYTFPGYWKKAPPDTILCHDLYESSAVIKSNQVWTSSQKPCIQLVQKIILSHPITSWWLSHSAVCTGVNHGSPWCLADHICSLPMIPSLIMFTLQTICGQMHPKPQSNMLKKRLKWMCLECISVII